VSVEALPAGERPVVAADRDEEFREFFAAEFPRLAGYCLRLLGDEQVARDTAQEALVRVWSRWLGVRDPRAYVYLVATNLVRSEWKDRARRADAWQRAAQAQPEHYELGDRTIRDVVERLPERLRVPVLLHYYADLPVAEVAQLIRRPVGSVKQRLHEARARLAAVLGDADG
jgi:RNA polymerase sigma-70 factor (ECF subfamily)